MAHIAQGNRPRNEAIGVPQNTYRHNAMKRTKLCIWENTAGAPGDGISAKRGPVPWTY
jgi:hypothetical protein